MLYLRVRPYQNFNWLSKRWYTLRWSRRDQSDFDYVNLVGIYFRNLVILDTLKIIQDKVPKVKYSYEYEKIDGICLLSMR